MLNKAVINLNILKQNAKKIKQRLNGTRLCAVVKADAYGHGASEISNALYSMVDCFAVALVEEGVSLRQSGIDKEILVLVPAHTSDYANAIRYNLTLTVQSVEELKNLEQACQNSDGEIKVHIKINTGMNRLGASAHNLERILDFASGLKRVKVVGGFSHYYNPQDKVCIEKSTSEFLLANKLLKGYNKNIISHISASGGFLQGQYFDMVRIGILLYGYLPYQCDFSVRPIMKVYAPVIKTREIEKGGHLLYGQEVLTKNQNISLVRYGYADGLPRKKINGMVNNRCMDICAISGELGCKYYPIMSDANLLASEYGTISYEILTKCAMRAQKIYIN